MCTLMGSIHIRRRRCCHKRELRSILFDELSVHLNLAIFSINTERKKNVRFQQDGIKQPFNQNIGKNRFWSKRFSRETTSRGHSVRQICPNAIFSPTLSRISGRPNIAPKTVKALKIP